MEKVWHCRFFALLSGASACYGIGMVTAAFDTLRAARDIERAGMERQHAEAIALAISQRGEGAALGAIAVLNSEIWKAAFTATGIVVAAIALATGLLLSQLA